MKNLDFGTTLRHLRTTHDFTQESLAEIVGCAAETIRSFENGRRRPSRQMAERLADVLHLPVEERQRFVQSSRGSVATPSTDTPSTNPALALRSIPLQRNQPSLYVPPDALIGRREELLRLRNALVDDKRRLVTLLGPGGIGKTRLALQSAADLAAQFPDGAAFVALAPLADSAHVAHAIAEALGSALPNAQSPDAAVVDLLQNQKLLLVLDNMEHLLAGEHGTRITALLTQIIHKAPGVQVLVTSRQRLALRGTFVIEVDALGLPAAEQLIGAERSDAVLLFLDRARQTDSEFALTANNKALVVRICRLLGGVPLAIELAASWLRALTCSEIAAEIEKSFEFLALSDSDLPLRHQSLRTVMEHSWQLLSAAEQQLLMRLSVFHGGCRREAVAAVAGSTPLGDQQAMANTALLALLASLVDKSLLHRVNEQDGATRYTLHEMVRQYAAAQHANVAEDVAATEARHAAYYVAWVAQQDQILKSAGQAQALHAITSEIDNVRAAWQWATEHRDGERLGQLLVTLDWFFELRGWHGEAARLFGQTHQHLESAATQPDAPKELQNAYWLLVGREGWHMLRRDPKQAASKMLVAVEHLRQVNHQHMHLHCIKGLAYLNMFSGNYAEAQALLDETLALATGEHNAWQRSVAQVVRGVLEVLRSDAETARSFLTQTLHTVRNPGDPRHVAMTLNYLGRTALSLELFEEAERYCSESLALASENKDRFQMSFALLSLGRVALSQGDIATTTWMFNEGYALAREIGDRWLEAQALGYLGTLAVHQDNPTKAGKHFRAAVATAAAAPIPFALDALADLAEFELQVQPQAALTALAYVVNHPRTRPDTRAAAERHWQRMAGAVSEQSLVEATSAASQQPQAEPVALLQLFE